MDEVRLKSHFCRSRFDLESMFTHAIVRIPPASLVNGITTANLGAPSLEKAMHQHQAYVDALRRCGLEVITLPADDNFPDCCFIEDTALLTKRGAIIARPGAASRRGEEDVVRQLLPNYFETIESIHPPGTVEPGDIMMVGNHFYIGLSERTNEMGARQMILLLQSFGLSGSTVELREMLHLKSGISYLENKTLLTCGQFLNEPAFQQFDMIAVDEEETYAANSLWINDHVLVPAGFQKTLEKIEAAGYQVIEIDVSEFQKLDGGLSCLSLRF